MAFIGLMILNGLIPKMRFEHEFKTQEEDPETVNDLCATMFGDNSNIQWKEFKLCFLLVDS